MTYMFDEKPSLEDLAHHGVKGQKWGVRRANAKLQKSADKVQSKSDHLQRLRDNKPKNTLEKIQRVKVVADSLGSKKVATYKLNREIGKLNAEHQKIIDRLNTPAAQRHMKTGTKVKIALGAAVAAHILLSVGSDAVGTRLVANEALRKGPRALGAVATATKFAKKSHGAFKITTL